MLYGTEIFLIVVILARSAIQGEFHSFVFVIVQCLWCWLFNFRCVYDFYRSQFISIFLGKRFRCFH